MTYKKLPSWAKVLYLTTFHRARRKAMQFTLTKDEYAAIFQRADGRCEISGLPFDVEPPKTRHGKRPFAASIDRIDSALGYSQENCRLVCVAANVAMNWWGSEVLLRLCAGVVAVHGRSNEYRKARGLKTLPGVKVRQLQTCVTYVAKIVRDGREMHLGSFATAEEANAAYLIAKKLSHDRPTDGAPRGTVPRETMA